MDRDEDDLPEESTEIGSDELLSEDDLRLPESANVLVRLHAVRSWLARRRHEVSIEVGEAALNLQQAMTVEPQASRPRRRERLGQEMQMVRTQQALASAQERLQAYEDAEALLEDCVTHTGGERVLVEYYLALEDLVQTEMQAGQSEPSPRLQALADVQHRVERVGAPSEE
jgi:hypothetical protein